jgi:hypothetical protein
MLLTVLPLFSFAQQLSSLTLFSEDGEKFILYLDGVQRNQAPTAELRVRDMTKMSYNARIVFVNRSLPDINNVIRTVTPQGWKANVTYKIVTNLKGQYTMRCLGVVPIKDNAYSSDNESAYSGTDGAGESQYIDQFSPTSQRTETVTTRDANNNIVTTTRVKVNYGMRDNSAKNPAGCIPMSPSDFEKARIAIGENDYDESKLILAKDYANSNCFTSQQVMEICKIFTLEKTKLNFAKFAFSQTVDPANYFKVNSAFETSESKRELFEYVSSMVK